jgi:hypothetical protein
MSGSHSRSAILWAAGWLLIPAQLLSSRNAGQAGPIAIVQELVRSAFPDLLVSGLPVRVIIDVGFDGDWTKHGLISFRVPPDTPPDARSAEEVAHQTLLGGNVLVDSKASFVSRANFSGTHMHWAELTALERTFEREANWKDEDLERALETLNARYLPGKRSQFVGDLRLSRFEPVLGTIRKSTTEFEWRFKLDADGPWQYLRAGWHVSLEATLSGVDLCYDLYFEPIDGRLRAVAGRRCGGP